MIDQVNLNFDPKALAIMNIAIAFIMYGVALDIKRSDFESLKNNKRAFLIGMFSQFFFLPMLSFAIGMAVDLQASLALGLLLVACCPGGNLSNFLTSFSGGNSALSIGMSSASTLLAIFLTPFNLSLWGSMNPKTLKILQTINIDAWDVFTTVFTILILPSFLGLMTTKFFPKFSDKMKGVFKKASFIFFCAFLIGALLKNKDAFEAYVSQVFGIVLVCNGIGLLFGYWVSRFLKLTHSDAIAVSFETGIQNAGFGLILIFSFFNGLGGMAVVAGWYGVWHLISGMSLAVMWAKKNKRKNIELSSGVVL